ncbi:MAG: cupin domain-containing protein [Planctomycetaceae bacterium]|jgi:quercetin dioxygenase-like cupin family protein|nr:cupin domain-containing protein [Planctomycetaceae bacterium]
MKRKFFYSVVLSIVCVVLFAGQRTRPIPPPKLQQEKSPTVAQSSMPILFLSPEEIHFPPQQQNNPNTVPRTVILLGDPKTEGLYVTRTLIPKGKQIIPHRHTDSRTVVVLSGTYYYGVGEEFDVQKLVPLPPGSFLTEPAGIPHFTWAKDSDVLIQTTAIGPSGTQIVPDKAVQKIRD